MVLLSSALIALILLLLVLKLSQRLTLRLRVLAGVSVSHPASKSCPHLGLAGDPFTHGERPADDHRCYLWMQRDRIDLVHQKGFCLTTAHHKCPWLMVRHPNAPVSLRQRVPQIPRRAWAGALAAFSAIPTTWANLRARKSAAAETGNAAAPRVQPVLVPVAAVAVAQPSAEREVAAANDRGERARREWESFGEPHATGIPALSAALAGIGRRVGAAAVLASSAAMMAARAAAPHVRHGAAVAGAYTWVALRWSARMLARLAVLLARGSWWLLRALGRGSRILAQSIQAKRQAPQPAIAAVVNPELAPSPIRLDAPAMAAAYEGEQLFSEPVVPPSLAALEELLAEGVETLDRGQETLAYCMFVKATEAKAPKIGGEQYVDLMKRAWFWRAKTSETVEDVVHSLEQALRFDPQNLQMQAHLAWAKQRLERELKLVMVEPTPADKDGKHAEAPLSARSDATWLVAIGESVRRVGGLLALALAVLWATTGIFPALSRFLTSLPASDQALLKRLMLTINVTALPGQGHLPVPGLNYDLGSSLPFVLAFLFVFTARGLVDGDTWARTGSLLLAGAGGYLCVVYVSNHEAGQLGLALCVGIVVAALLGRFHAPKVLRPVAGGVLA